jgi:hypothetical protein
MTITESGVIAGVPVGAIIGGVICRSHGAPGVLGGSLAGVVAGGLVGWVYAFFIIFLFSVVGVLWRTARRRPVPVPPEADMDLMTPIGVRGIFAAALLTLLCWHRFGWPQGLVAAVAIGAATAIIAVGRCELR